MSACHCGGLGVLAEVGGASSTSMAEPHFWITHSGASRSVSPDKERTERRFFEDRKSGDESWYLSTKRVEGRARYICKEHVSDGGVTDCDAKDKRRVGCNPVGERNEA